MTKKELIKFLENVPDDWVVKHVITIISEWEEQLKDISVMIDGRKKRVIIR